MDAKELILEIFRETDFVAESHLAGSTIDETSTEQIQLSIAAINKACSAYLNGQDVEPHTERFLRRSQGLPHLLELGVLLPDAILRPREQHRVVAKDVVGRAGRARQRVVERLLPVAP